MPSRKPVENAKPNNSKSDPDVVAFLRELDHPLKEEIEAVLKIILGANPAIGEGIKWNSVSFRTTEYFATIHLRSTDRVQLVFHRGAKAKDNAKDMTIPDPNGLIKWLAKDRCLVTLGAGKDIAANRRALETIVREWVKQM